MVNIRTSDGSWVKSELVLFQGKPFIQIKRKTGGFIFNWIIFRILDDPLKLWFNKASKFSAYIICESFEKHIQTQFSSDFHEKPWLEQKCS